MTNIKNTIDTVFVAIDKKQQELINYVETSFLKIEASSKGQVRVINESSKSKTPPISYILYGIAGVCLIGGYSLIKDSMGGAVACFGASVLSGYYGYKTSSNSHSRKVSIPRHPQMNPNEIKVRTVDVVANCCKHISNEWDTFMGEQLETIRANIEKSELSNEQKDAILDKLYTPQVIDVTLIKFHTAISNAADDVTAMKTAALAFKQTVLSEIAIAIEKQKDILKTIKM